MMKNKSQIYQWNQRFYALAQQLAVPSSEAEILAKALKASGYDLASELERLKSIGALDEAELGAQSSLWNAKYATLNIQRYMLEDEVRGHAFKKAIEEVVGADSVVIDVGGGSGLLSFFAAQAGSQEVHCIEQTSIQKLSRRIAEDSGLDRAVRYFDGPAESFPTVQADVIISEWIGIFVITEYMYRAFRDVRDRCLKPGGTVVPSRVDMFMAPVESYRLYRDHGPGFWAERPYGLDFRSWHEEALATLKPAYTLARENEVVAESVRIQSIDCLHDNEDSYHFACSEKTVIRRDATIHGLVGYFDVQLTPSVSFTTSPAGPPTHWKQLYFPVPAFDAKQGDVLELDCKTTPGGLAPLVHVGIRLHSNGNVVHTYERTYEI